MGPVVEATEVIPQRRHFALQELPTGWKVSCADTQAIPPPHTVDRLGAGAAGAGECVYDWPEGNCILRQPIKLTDATTG